MKLWPGSLFFACANLSKWKCSSLYVPAHKKNGTNTGNRKGSTGTRALVFLQKNIVFTIMQNWRFMLMPHVTLSMNFQLDLRKWKVYIQELTMILESTRNTVKRNYNTSITILM